MFVFYLFGCFELQSTLQCNTGKKRHRYLKHNLFNDLFNINWYFDLDQNSLYLEVDMLYEKEENWEDGTTAKQEESRP